MDTPEWIAFAGTERIAHGPPDHTAAAAQAWLARREERNLLIFDARTGDTIDIDLSVDGEHLQRIVAWLTRPPATGSAEPSTAAVRLFRRHWDWLSTQPGGASAALRRLVEHAMRTSAAADRQRTARDAAYRFMTALAGDQPHYEDALRALYAGDHLRLAGLICGWPADVQTQVAALLSSGREQM